MTHEDLAALEAEGIALMRVDRYSEAIPIWERILQADPDWEHGLAWSQLGVCLEEMGNLENAQIAYKRALAIEPWNINWNGLYCSFAFLHGKSETAYQLNLRYCQIAAYYSRQEEDPPYPVVVLGTRMGLSMDQIRADYCKAVQLGQSGVFPPTSIPNTL